MKRILFLTLTAGLFACSSVQKEALNREPQQVGGDVSSKSTIQNYDSIYEIANIQKIDFLIDGNSPAVGSVWVPSNCEFSYYIDGILMNKYNFRMLGYHSDVLNLNLHPGLLKTKLSCDNGGTLWFVPVPSNSENSKTIAETFFKPQDDQTIKNKIKNFLVIVNTKSFEIERTVLIKSKL